jgi:hypothetical protein
VSTRSNSKRGSKQQAAAGISSIKEEVIVEQLAHSLCSALHRSMVSTVHR